MEKKLRKALYFIISDVIMEFHQMILETVLAVKVVNRRFAPAGQPSVTNLARDTPRPQRSAWACHK